MSAVLTQSGASTDLAMLVGRETAAPRPDPDDLRELVRAVNETTQRLQATHVALHEQVARLQDELAQANAALRRSQQLAALGEMAAGIAHEVRNPLGSIQLYANMLADDLAHRPQQSELCAKILRSVNGLDSVVRDVLAFARDTTICPVPTDSADILDRAVASCESLLKDVRVVRSEARAIRFHADVGLIVQATGNLIRNAVEAMMEQSASSPRALILHATRRRIRCSDGAQESRVIFSVQDTGPGIPADVVNRVFNPFFTTRKTGTGLGLAIVHRIVDAHGGHVHIRPAEPCGTIVELLLPFEPPAGSARSRSIANTLEPTA